ncbi:ATP-binding protein [Kitasatospora acidiphila]|uniref:ATP-binding protein n=1 Tax=Kitasatospora acidiphila TaxID=2567942 RepID=UPI003C76EB29
MPFTAGMSQGANQLTKAPIPVPLIPATTACASTESVTIDLPYRPEAASAARRLVRKTVTEWHLEGLVDDAELIASELVTNAAKTGCTQQLRFQLERLGTGSVRIRVTDRSRDLPVMAEAGDQAESGRGITLVDHLTRGHWGIEQLQDGKTVHADLLGTWADHELTECQPLATFLLDAHRPSPLL